MADKIKQDGDRNQTKSAKLRDIALNSLRDEKGRFVKNENKQILILAEKTAKEIKEYQTKEKQRNEKTEAEIGHIQCDNITKKITEEILSNIMMQLPKITKGTLDNIISQIPGQKMAQPDNVQKDTAISQVLEQIDNGKIKIFDSSDAPKQLRDVPLNPEQMERAVKFAQALPEEWKTVLPAKDYIQLPRTRDKVAIVGFANSWRKAPFGDKTFEIWGINELYKYIQAIPDGRADRWFEIHNRKSPSKSRPEHQEWLKKANIPIYMWEHYDDMPGSMPYPKDALLEKLKGIVPFGYKYFTNQISWMLALAWYEGFKEVQIYGVNMATDSEFNFQRPSCESWIFFLQAMGIKVYLPEECDLLKPMGGHLYGFESDNAARVLNKQRIADLKPRNGALQKQIGMSEFKRDEVLRELRKTEGRVVGMMDALKAQNREQVETIIKQLRNDLEGHLAAYVQLDGTIRQSDMNLAELRGAAGAYDDVLKHIL